MCIHCIYRLFTYDYCILYSVYLLHTHMYIYINICILTHDITTHAHMQCVFHTPYTPPHHRLPDEDPQTRQQSCTSARTGS